MNIIEIITGWKNAMYYNNLPEKTKQLINKRISICTSCPELSISRKDVKTNNFNFVKILENITGIQKNELNGLTCPKCGCGLNAKVANFGYKCPIGKW
jgi:hypothetical protein